DPSRLRQILSNLVSNAVKFTDAGNVSLEVKVLETTEARQRLCFSVQDTGLGLVISRQLVELMGGSIQVTSTEGRGTRVAVTLAAEPASPIALHDGAQSSSGEA